MDHALLSYVAEAGQELRAAADLDGLVRAAAQMMVPGLADLAAIRCTVSGGPQELIVVHRDLAAACRLQRQIVAELLPTLEGAARNRAQRWGRAGPLWLRRVTPRTIRMALGTASHEEIAAAFHRLNVHSLIIAELEGQGASLGWIGLGRGADRPEFGGADLAAAVVLVRRAALAIQAAVLQEARARETSARVQAEAGLWKWAQVFLHAGWGAAIIDPKSGTIEVVNPAFARLHGFEGPDAVAGRRFEEVFLSPEEGQPPPPLPPPGGVTYETHHVRTDTGARFPVLVDLTPIPGDTGDPAYCAAYVQDLSELKRAQDRLREVERLEAVGRLAGGVAHEVNNMMTIVIGYADLVLGMPELPNVARDELRQIRQAADHAAGVSRQLLAYSRRQVLRPTVVDLNQIVSNAARLLGPLLPEDIVVDIQLAEPAGLGVHVDRGQIERIIVNLALNARDAMPGGGRLELATDYRHVSGDFGARWLGFPMPPGRYAFLTAKDTGGGIDPEIQARLFEPFFTTKPIGKGTGLGLSMTYGIVKQSGGYIWVDSHSGGTTFTLCFPAVPLDDNRRDRRRRGRIGSGASVLVVDDELAVRSVCTRLLRESGYDAEEAATGDAALATLERLEGDVRIVLTDIVMPDMSGPELRACVEERWPGVPVLFMSGYPGSELARRGLLAEGETLLQKPFSAVELAAAVAEVLNRDTRLSVDRAAD